MNETASFSESDELEIPSPPTPEEESDVSLAEETQEYPPDTAPISIIPIQEFETPAIIAGIGKSQSSREPLIKAAVRCETGVRERNDDSYVMFSSAAGGHFKMLPFGLYIVADGMGGHKNGHIASRIASRIAAHHILSRIYLPLLENMGPPVQAPIQEVLLDAIQAANTAVYQDDLEVDSGTTLTVALLLGRRLHVAHVGDSRLYLLADGKFQAVTSDHSLVQRLQDVGQLSAEEATSYPYRHVLIRAVGQEEEVEIDTYLRLLPKEGKLLLCSDGLCGEVPDDELHRILEQEIEPEAIAGEMFEAAVKANSMDNITAVVVDFNF